MHCPTDWAGRINGNVASTNYAGIYNDIELPIDKDGNGILFLNSSVRYEQITDGSSNTLLLAEKLRGADTLGWVSGTRDTLRNVSGMNVGQTTPGMPAIGNPSVAGGISSRHVGGLQGALADGSVRFFSSAMNMKLLQNMANRHDGEVIPRDGGF